MRLMPSIYWYFPPQKSNAASLFCAQLSNLAPCAKTQFSGPESSLWSAARPFAPFRAWDGDRLIFLRRKWFGEVQPGDAQSPAGYWNMNVTHSLQWQFHNGRIENEYGLLVRILSLLMVATAMTQDKSLPDTQTMKFFGTLSLANNGGFASVRTKPKKFDLEKGDILVAKFRGDGREYTLNLSCFSELKAFQELRELWIVIDELSSPATQT